MCKILQINVNKTSKQRKANRQNVANYKQQWKHTYKSEVGSIRSIPDEVHSAFFKGGLEKVVVGAVIKKIRGRLEGLKRLGSKYVGFSGGLAFGWKSSGNRNRHLLFKNVKGRIRLFESGTVELYVRKPSSGGKAMGLFSDGFLKPYLITDIRVVDQFRSSLMRRFHASFDVGQKLPYFKVDAFKESHNFSMVSGDRTHPTSFEFMFGYNAEVQTARDLVEEMKKFFEQFGKSGPVGKVKDLDKSSDYSL